MMKTIQHTVQLKQISIFSYLQEVKKVYTYLDLDANHAGQNATQKLKDKGFNVYDQSSIYTGFKDFNEFLIAGTKPP